MTNIADKQEMKRTDRRIVGECRDRTSKDRARNMMQRSDRPSNNGCRFVAMGR